MIKRFDATYPITVQVCPVCRKSYDDYSQASGCAKSHSIPDEYIGFSGFDENFNAPDTIYMLANDGRQLVYQLVADEEPVSRTEVPE
jgi:hypothetical protein